MECVKNKNLLLIMVLSLFACVLHGVMLFTPFNDYLFTSAVKIVLFVLCPVLYVAFSKDGTVKDLFFRKGDWKSIRYSLVLAGGALVFMISGFAVIHPWLDESMITHAMSNVGITGSNYIFAVLYYVVVNVALEELFFRGFIFLTLYRLGYKWYAHLYSSLLFAIYHVAIMQHGVEPMLLVLATVGLVCVGLFFNEITRRCGNLIGAWAVHVGAGVGIGVVGWYLVG